MNEQYNSGGQFPPAGQTAYPHPPGETISSAPGPIPQNRYAYPQPYNRYGDGAPNLFDDHRPYEGGIPVRCPKCGYTAASRFCGGCGLDLSTVYTISDSHPGQVYVVNYGMSYYPASYGSSPGTGYPAASNGYPSPNGGYRPDTSRSFNSSPMPLSPPSIPVTPIAYAPKKHSTKRTVLWICGLCLLFIVIFIVSCFFFQGLFQRNQAAGNPIPNTPPNGPITSPNQEYYRPEGISLEEYNQLKTGMSYARVSAIIGGDGQVVTQGENIDGKSYTIYGWYGETSPSVSVYVTIVDDKVTEISNEGLTDGE